MSTRLLIIFLIFCSSSCLWKAYSDEKYIFGSNLKALVDCYKIGDTLVFKNQANSVDTFIITKIDSVINNKKGFFINTRNYKSVRVLYKQYPVDKWQSHWIEMGPNNSEEKEVYEDGTLISIGKYPDDGTSGYYCNFKEFRCSNSEILKLYTDTLILGNCLVTNYFKLDNCDFKSDAPNSIQVCYSTIGKGLIAFKTKNGEIWTRQN